MQVLACTPEIRKPHRRGARTCPWAVANAHYSSGRQSSVADFPPKPTFSLGGEAEASEVSVSGGMSGHSTRHDEDISLTSPHMSSPGSRLPPKLAVDLLAVAS